MHVPKGIKRCFQLYLYLDAADPPTTADVIYPGGGWGETPDMIVKRLGCTAIHNKALYKSLIHSLLLHSALLFKDMFVR